MHLEFLAPTSSPWRQMLSEVSHDVYHFPEYCSLFARMGGGTPTALYAEDGYGSRFLLPLIIRPVGAADRQLYDAVSPYGYPGPLVDIPASDGHYFLVSVLREIKPFLRERRIISLFARLHPILGTSVQSFSAAGRLVKQGESISIDLTVSEDEAWAQIDPDHRRNINKSWRDGGIRVFIDWQWEHFAAFHRLYIETMNRHNADKFYFFSRDHLDTLRELLGMHVHLCIVEIERQIAAAGIITENCGIIQGYLNGTSQPFIRKNPTLVMYDFLRRWGKQRGNHYFHLGSGVGGHEDSLFAFKARFSKLRHPYYTWRLIADEAAYEEQLREWGQKTGLFPDDEDGYFPAYRKPAGRCASLP